MRSDAPLPGRVLPSPRALRRSVAFGIVALFVVRFAYFLFLDLADGRAGHVPERLFNESTGALLALLPVGATVWLAGRMPLVRPLRRGTIPVYAAAFVLLSIAHTTAMIVVRAALAPSLGLRGYDYAFPFVRYAYEGANDVVFFVATIAILALSSSIVAQRDRERRAAALERELLRAELSNLRLQLQPHFLFNALNTISSTMYDDVEAADALLGRLAELLRTSLRTTHTQEVAARDELEILSTYLELMRARFGDRLDVTVDAPRDVEELLVPSMVLQPLVENAVRHGGVARVGRGVVRVSLRSDGEMLELRVRDSAATRRTSIEPQRTQRTQRQRMEQSFASSASSAVQTTAKSDGTGLTTTSRRLALLYGADHSMTAGPVDDGWEVVIRIPARRASAVPNESKIAEALA